MCLCMCTKRFTRLPLLKPVSFRGFHAYGIAFDIETQRKKETSSYRSPNRERALNIDDNSTLFINIFFFRQHSFAYRIQSVQRKWLRKLCGLKGILGGTSFSMDDGYAWKYRSLGTMFGYNYAWATKYQHYDNFLEHFENQFLQTEKGNYWKK